MSATLGAILKELDPSLKIEVYEVLGSEGQESSSAWNPQAVAFHRNLCPKFRSAFSFDAVARRRCILDS
jgi:Malate:quinone oxidoreductase (Mqo)